MKSKYCILLVVCFLLLSLAGCSGKAVVLTNPEQAMNEVCERNIAVLNTFRNQGLISEAQYSNYVVALRTRSSTYIDLIKKAQKAESESDVNFKATLEMLQSSLVHRFGETKADGSYYGRVEQGGDCPDNESLYYLTSMELSNNDNEENIHTKSAIYEVVNMDEFKNLIAGSNDKKYDMVGKGENAKPLIFIDENNLDSLITEINKQVYVLDESKLKTYEDWQKLVEALHNIKQAEFNSNVSNDENYRHLRNIAINYFKPTNQTVYNFQKDDIIKVSEDNSDNLGLSSGANAMNKDVIINGILSVKEHTHKDESCDIADTTASVGVYALRVQEFDGEFYKKVSQESYTKDKYVTLQPVSGDEVGVALLMEYPVEVIDSLEADSLNSSSWHFNFKDTDMKLNIYNGEMLVKDEDGDYISINSEENEDDKIYRVFPANIGLDTATGKNNSFEPHGAGIITTGEIVLHDVAATERLSTVKFLLKDYLELTYIPGIVNDENFIATGRRITINKFSGSSDEVIGYYIDKLGDKFLNGARQEISVMASDLIDYTSGSEGYYESIAKALAFDGYINEGEVKEELSKSEEDRGSKLSNIFLSKYGGIGLDSGLRSGGAMMLPYTIYIDRVNTVLQFTSSSEEDRPGLDSIDVNNDKVAPSLYYGICLNTNIYVTGLLTTWINTTFEKTDTEITMVQGHGGEGGSLQWWNAWLSSHGYNYAINVSNLNSRLSSMYAIDLAEISDKIIFDVDTLAVINKELNEKVEQETRSLLKTAQVILGILFLVYGFFMMACWLIDTNLVNGPGLLTIITFGKMASIRDDSEVPRMVDGKIYADFKFLCILTVILILLGIMLIIFDLQQLRGILDSLFESAIKLFSDLLLNKD